MKIAVTGAAGLLGREIVKRSLADGHEVVALDRVASDEAPVAGVRWVRADVGDYEALKSAFAGCDALIHMAAIISPKGRPAHVVHNENVSGSYNALSAAIETGIRRICQASSVNAIGHAYSRRARYDYFPIDEFHPSHCEDPYGLSKWICEQQAEAMARCHDGVSIASLRFHHVTADRAELAVRHGADSAEPFRHLWAWTHLGAAADACLRAVEGRFEGHEVFFIVSPTTLSDVPSETLCAEHFPEVPLRQELYEQASFFSCAKARRMLGWDHDAAFGV